MDFSKCCKAGWVDAQVLGQRIELLLSSKFFTVTQPNPKCLNERGFARIGLLVERNSEGFQSS